MKNALKAKNKFGFINGSVKKPNDAESDESFAWEVCNSMINGWIHNTIDLKLQPFIQYFETAKVLWDDLKERYAIQNIPRQYQLKSGLPSVKQHGMSLSAYYTKLRAIWDELEGSRSIPSCPSGDKCPVTKHLQEESEKDLSPKFRHASSTQPMSATSSSSDVDRPVTKGRGKGRKNGGRTVSTPGASANATQALSATTCANISSNRNATISILTPEVIQRLLSLVEPAKSCTETLSSKEPPFKWLIDSGASHHMTRSLDVMSKLETIVPSPVGLPNGVQTTALKRGSVVLGLSFVLEDVLYVPNLSCNLIYVTQLIHSKNCHVTFTDKLCVIQDLTSRIMIGLGEQQEGVYVYKPLWSSVFAFDDAQQVDVSTSSPSMEDRGSEEVHHAPELRESNELPTDNTLDSGFGRGQCER
ncbi:Retrotransposon gag domain [Sesbania bispinosa]|nr:Retrotransposon gag domain [Sesbania bispinosa]